MKRLSIIMVMLTMLTVSMMAVPANRKAVKITQPDGSTVTIQLQGDEWQHFNTTTDGYSVVKNQQGYYVYAEKKDGELIATQMVAHNALERKANELAFLQDVKKYQAPDMTPAMAHMKDRVEAIGAQRRAQKNRATNYSNFRGLIVLIQYNDKEFSREDFPTIIDDMVNQQNYTGFDNNQRTGSVRDYFTDNSGGKFQPQFDIVGPYTVDYSQYDANVKEGKSRQILIDALNQADADVNFKDYDGDGDGMVDLVFFIVAGNGANYGGNDENLWWPHRSMIFDDEKYNAGKNPYIFKDGVLLWDYASSTELRGYTASPQTVFIDGIGTICHEFSHVLGLPDFYDSDYEENGQSVTPGDWSLMDSGCYLNNGFTPASYSLYERYLAGFTDKPETISQPGNYTLEPLYNNQKGYCLNTPEVKEFFFLENRQRSQCKWDAYLPGDGMLVYRIDRSNKGIWEGNKVNANPEHNYYVLLRAGGETKSSASDPFPGKKKVLELTNESSPANLKTWTGKNNQFELYDIQQTANGDITFTVNTYNPIVLSNFSELKDFQKDKEVYLNLNDAHVLFTNVKENSKITYLRDNTGALMISGVNIPAKANDIINGTLYIQTAEINNVPQAVGIENTDPSTLTITEGSEVLPREVSFDDLSAADYSDLIVVKGVSIKKDAGLFGNYWAYSNKTDNTARIWSGNFGISSGLNATTQFNGNYFDITGIYGTDLLNGSIINELNVTKAVEEGTAPTGIMQIDNGQDETANSPIYNMAGQRVSNNFKGLIIKDGKKFMSK